MNIRRALLTLAACSIATAAFAEAPPPIPSNEEIHKILEQRVGAANRGIAIVVGVIDSNGRRIVSYGSLAKGDKRTLDGNTVFEIGSMTKVFTSLILMDMVRRGEVALTDPVAKFLPSTVKVPERNGRKITLADLSTQTSGLPRMPSNFNPKDASNPYADYSVQQMYDFISGYQLTRDIGEKYEYSNLGVGLLGHALALRAGMSYEDLVRERITKPLEMADTRITLTPDMKARLAFGHSETMAQVSNWDLPTFAGAGALRSTANDMLTFLSANLGYIKTPLAQVMADEVSIRKPTGVPDLEIAYAWHVQTKDGSSIIWHNGGTGGYRTFMGFDPKARTGVVVLANISTAAGQDDIGRHLLNPAYPLAKIEPPSEHKEITLDPAVIEKYVGEYQLGPGMLLTMTRDGNRMYTQLTGQPKFELFGEGERKFFLKVVDAQVTFDVDPQGNVTQAVLHQNGQTIPAKRITADEAKRAADELEARKKAQTPAPGSEAALRRTIQELQKGEPNYDLMSPQFAAVTRQQLPQLKALITGYGAVQSVTFKSVEANGYDTFEVKFEHANIEWVISVGADGKILSAGFHPL